MAVLHRASQLHGAKSDARGLHRSMSQNPAPRLVISGDANEFFDHAGAWAAPCRQRSVEVLVATRKNLFLPGKPKRGYFQSRKKVRNL
jgi:hypothetical protein